MELSKLANRFRQQQRFSKTYSPLYACLFGAVADWLAAEKDRPLVEWLLAASQGRNSLDVSLLLSAGIHRDILDGVKVMESLARYFITAGGELSCDDEQFRPVLRQAIMARRHVLAPFIQTAAVQTNETGRGLVWLVPLLFVPWPSVHLVDLGASAGLNLVADERAYRLIDAHDGRLLADLGKGQPVQFSVQSQGKVESFIRATRTLPVVSSRTGCDLAPFALRTMEDERTLAAFVWGDQPERLKRLREGIAALHKANVSNVPVHLCQANLPDGLPRFLRDQVPASPLSPVVIYNTYMTAYLADKGADLRRHIQAWVATLNQPVLWLQWEPDWQGAKAPEYGWCTWTVDLWWAGNHRHWHLAWVHPHGASVKWEEGLQGWAEFWQGVEG